MQRIGLLTAGGDTPALNATIHGAVTRASAARVEVYGLMKGFNPLFQPIPELDSTIGGTLEPHRSINALMARRIEYLVGETHGRRASDHDPDRLQLSLL